MTQTLRQTMTKSDYRKSWAQKTAPHQNKFFMEKPDNSTLLDDRRSKLFHGVVMQLQFLSKHASPDVRTTMSILSESYKCNENDWTKYCR